MIFSGFFPRGKNENKILFKKSSTETLSKMFAKNMPCLKMVSDYYHLIEKKIFAIYYCTIWELVDQALLSTFLFMFLISRFANISCTQLSKSRGLKNESGTWQASKRS